MLLKITEQANRICVSGANYILELAHDSFMAKLQLRSSCQRYYFAAGGDCPAVGTPDALTDFSTWRIVRRDEQRITLCRELASPLWESKVFHIEADANSLEFYFELESATLQPLEAVRFFRLCRAGTEYGFAGNFDEVCNTAPNFQERRYYHPTERFRITAGNDFGPNIGSQALASPLPVMGLHDRRENCFWTVGAAAVSGENDWDDFYWNPQPVIPQTSYPGDDLYGGGFSLEYYGKRTIRGRWRTPSLLMTGADDASDIIPQFLETAFLKNYLPRPVRRRRENWWNTPIYCTWHDQTSYARIHAPERPAGDFCTRQLTEEWLAQLDAHDCRPGIVILDDKWQLCKNAADPDPDKWPNFREWVDSCHQRNIRVFLWNLAWTVEGLPDDECITDADGKPVACDVTNPKFAARFQNMIRRYFSAAPDGLNCDGIKLDGQLNLPTGRGLKNYGNVWGLELQRRYLELLHDTAKKVKPDVCISTFCANPYLERYCDMVRIADMYASRLTPHDAMLHRAEVYRQTMPTCLIDTDGQFNQHLGDDDYADELEEQRRIGIPSLYNAQWLYRWRFFLPIEPGELTQADYRTIAAVFRRFRETPNSDRPQTGHRP